MGDRSHAIARATTQREKRFALPTSHSEHNEIHHRRTQSPLIAVFPVNFARFRYFFTDFDEYQLMILDSLGCTW